MRLEAQAPPRVLEAVARREFGVRLELGAVHRLQEEVFELQPLELRGSNPMLRVDELQLVARALLDHGASLGAHADPVDTGRRLECAVRFDRDLEAESVEARDERFVELQEGFTARHHNKAFGCAIAEPLTRNFFSKLLCVRKLRSTDKIGVAKLADGACSIFLTPSPEVATCESQEYRWPSSIRALTLQGVVDLFDGIAHTAANPCSRMRQESQWPQGVPSGDGS